MRVEILGQERRRRWRDEEKREIVMSVGVSGATVTEVAHRHHVTRQQIYTWRSELKKKGLLSPSTNAVFISTQEWNDFLDSFVDEEGKRQAEAVQRA
ncbi:helix-turn-helix domain-containing protein [Sinorhizobium meliloti]|uniref:transposase n=1 Tax=Rhizobium meliloti TaxID=382 RepID=UPI000FDA3D19|nr:helix-turn-helix domain-containing protein [Sinorhizobium meliloti]RVI72903.1 helix-turn-helix domain-containing protein [Sinorhizobium meliloti]